jgi:hypothetical protein
MRNHDESILRSYRVDRRAPFPPLHQALRIALYDEYAARAFYGGVVEAFGNQRPFVALLRSQNDRIDQLNRLCSRYGVPRPLDPFPAETQISPAWRTNLERAVTGKANSIQLYQALIQQVGEMDAASALAKLNRTAVGNHLPSLQRALQSAVDQEILHARHGVAPSEAYVQHGPLSDFLEKAFSVLGNHNQAFGVVGPLLKSRPALLAGVAAGVGGIYFARKRVRQNRKEG